LLWKRKKQTKQQPRNELHERKKAKPQQNWTSKLCETGTVKSRLENKKQKVFEFSIESQMPKQNGKKYNQEYYNKSIKQKNEKIEEKSNLNLTPHTTVFHQFPIEAMIGPGTELALKQYSVFQEINSFNVFLYSIFQPSWGAWQPIWFVPRPQYQAASVDFMPAMSRRPSPRAHPKSLVVHRPRPPAPPLPRPSFAKSTMPSFANAF